METLQRMNVRDSSHQDDIKTIVDRLTNTIHPFATQLNEINQIYVEMHVFFLVYEKVIFSNKMKNTNIYTVRTVIKSNLKIVETEYKSIPLTNMYMTADLSVSYIPYLCLFGWCCVQPYLCLFACCCVQPYLRLFTWCCVQRIYV